MQVSKPPFRRATRHWGASIARIGIYANQLKQDYPAIQSRPKSYWNYALDYEMAKAALTPYAHTVHMELQPGS
jgi:hypothetical protein